ncbi:MFS transporter [Sutterella sp.]|uniref:MFS transporter n=1 Tax=Sutterella sp. TaxID=1981025 RepID=UPI0026DEAF58|nr:MFS transporter [Sutterella sp.]MDO5531145.1 MFS transporter [Sutterella sp.]
MRWQPLLKVLVLPLCLHSCATGMRFTATLDALSRGASSFEVGAMLACVSLAPALLAVQTGRWLDTGGPKAPVVTAMFTAACAGLAPLVTQHSAFGLVPLFLACFLAGLSFMLLNTVAQRLTGDICAPEDRQTGFTVLSLVTATSNLATPVIAGYLIEHISFAAFYVWCLIAPVILALLLSMPFMRGLLVKRSRDGAAAAKPAATAEEKRRRSSLDFMRDRPMQAVLLASVVISIAWEVGNLLIPVYCAHAGLSPSAIGWVLASFASATFVVRVIMPALFRFVKEWHMIAMTLAISATAFALFPLFTTLPPLMGAAFLLGLGLGASLPNMMSLVYLFAPGDRIGEAIGFRLMLINAAKTVFPIGAGALGAVIGAGASLMALAVFTAGGFLYTLSASKCVLARMKERRGL